jgi:hypothetical protein
MLSRRFNGPIAKPVVWQKSCSALKPTMIADKPIDAAPRLRTVDVVLITLDGEHLNVRVPIPPPTSCSAFARGAMRMFALPAEALASWTGGTLEYHER